MKGILNSADKDQYAFFYEMGAGKTATAINAFRYKCYRAKRLLRCIVFCPPIVVENWRREFKAHSTINNIFPLTGTMAQRYKLFLDKCEKKRGDRTGAVFITNYEALLHKMLFQAFLDWEPEALIFDESHKLKSPDAKRTKLATELADGARFKWLLSGTPVLKNALDLYSQFRVMDRGETFGKNFYSYRAQYFYDRNAGMPKGKYFPNWQPRLESERELGLLISNKSMHIKKEDCLDLPPLVRKEVYVELGKQQARLYESMKKDLIAMIEDKACVARLAMTKALRLQQIATGFVKVEDMDGNEEEVQIKDNPRARALKDLLEEITTHSKVLVWACFKNNYSTIRAICEDLGLEYVEVHGDVSAKKRDAAIDAFQTDPAVKVFLGHPQSGGIGCNLTAASYSIFYSKNFSLEDDLQAEARNHRGGSEVHEKITRIDLIAQGTIDELISGKLKKKQEIGNRILGEIARKL
jgi:SNF2 family DNA or RNA helicase